MTLVLLSLMTAVPYDGIGCLLNRMVSEVHVCVNSPTAGYGEMESLCCMCMILRGS